MWALLECMRNNITFSEATIPDLESQINSDLKYIDRWLKANKLDRSIIFIYTRYNSSAI